jgi:hypothetical protein
MGESGRLEETPHIFQPHHVPQLVPWVWHCCGGLFGLCGRGQSLSHFLEVGFETSLNSELENNSGEITVIDNSVLETIPLGLLHA